MPTLYYMPGACSLASHIALEWIGQPYETKAVSFGDAEYRKINPAGAVPALADNGKVLTQSAAILRYLARKHPEAGLGDNGSLEDAYELDRWLVFLAADIHPAFSLFFAPKRFTTSEDKAQQGEVRAAAIALLNQRLALLDAHLAGRDHIVGNRRTIADPYAWTMLGWAMGLPEKLSAFPNLARFHAQLAQDSGVQSVLKQEGMA